MPFDQLDGDVLLHIFYLTDVYTILSLSGVNQLLRAIASTKHLWLLVVQNLARRGLIGPANSWEDLSTEELVDEVRRTVDGPRSWCSGAVATIRRRIAFPLDPDSDGRADFLHGGKYILLYIKNGCRGLQCWQVLPSRRLWTWRSSTHYVSQAKLDFSRGEFNPLVVLVCVPFTGLEETRIIILDVDLKTGDSSEMFVLDLPTADLGLPRLPQISGNIFACTFYFTSGWSILLLDWSTQKFVLFALAPRTQLWQPVDVLNLDNPTILEAVVPITPALPLPSVYSKQHQFDGVSVLESPLHAGTYTLVVTTTDFVINDAPQPPPSRFARLRDRIIKSPPPIPQKVWLYTRTLYRLTLPTRSDPVFHRPIPMSGFCWHGIYKWYDPYHRVAFTSIAASDYGLRWIPAKSKGPVSHMARIGFQRLREGALGHPRPLATTVADEVHDIHSTKMRISDTGIVMLQCKAQVVLYCPLEQHHTFESTVPSFNERRSDFRFLSDFSTSHWLCARACGPFQPRFQNLITTNTPPSDAEAKEFRRAFESNTDEITQLSNRIAALSASNRSLAAVLSVVRTLPFDILAQIFGQTVAVTDDPWPLTQICRGWRAIALDLPSIWASIDIDSTASNPRLRPTEYPLEKLQALLQRSANYPLTSDHADRLFATLVSCSVRWRTFFLRARNTILPLLAPVQGSVPILRSLILDTYIPPGVRAFEIAPMLHALKLPAGVEFDATASPFMAVPWSQITHLSGDFPYYQDRAAVLERLRNLVECDITMINWSSNNHQGIVSLPRLQRLYVMHGDCLEFKVPQLTELVVEPLRMRPFPDVLGNLTQLQNRSGCHLTKFCLIGALTADHDNQRLISVLTLLPSLVDLCVQSRGKVELVTLDELILALRPAASACLLPRLASLTIGGYRFTDSATLVDVLNERVHCDVTVCSPLRSFKLFHIIQFFVFSAEQTLRLRQLQTDGLDFVEVSGPAAHAAIVSVPFFKADNSAGQYWAPETQSF
ncbi:hypothetical protein C8R46DRAFT_1199184 [Mycena filopes]|nr:hypothetical protein C8R46DRAFT_1199184 [Mycena filopes]